MIVIKNLCYDSPAGDRLFDDLSVTFPAQKTGLVGRNGAGKTMLLRLILGELRPAAGSIQRPARLAYLPQDYRFDLIQSVAGALDIQERLDALTRIQAGEADPKLLALAEDNWNLADRARRELGRFDLPDLAFERTLASLSGGERMKVALAHLALADADFLLLDEPTNNLDRAGREAVYAFLRAHRGGLLVASHDRELLECLDAIAEISRAGIRTYGGNYSLYVQQKRDEREALERQLASARQALRKDEKEAAIVRDRQQHRRAEGHRATRGQKIPKGRINTLISQATGTDGRLALRHEQKIGAAQDKLDILRARLPDANQILIDLPRSRVPRGKLVAEFKEVFFSYDPARPLLEDIGFTICGPERVALSGRSGAGKTTLVKLLLGELTPQRGQVRLGVHNLAYLDQHGSSLEPSQTLLAQLRERSALNEQDARDWLARFLFTDQEVFKACGALSGGERLCAALAIALAAAGTPELLILDEPTNSLDLDGIERLESTLRNFHGALLIISHDRVFLEHIEITREIRLDKHPG